MADTRCQATTMDCQNEADGRCAYRAESGKRYCGRHAALERHAAPREEERG